MIASHCRGMTAAVAVGLLLSWAGPSRAEGPAKPSAAPATAAPASPAAAPAEDVSNAIVPELNVQGVQLREMIDFLQDAVPGFKAVVFRDPGVAEDDPMVNMRLKGVAVSQILALLTTAYPNLEVNEIGGAGGTIYCIKVHSAAAAMAAMAAAAAGLPPQPGGGGVIGGGPGFAGWVAPTPPPVVKVYPLSDTVMGLVGSRPDAAQKNAAAAAKDALAQVLSLIKATMAQVTDAGAAGPVLQVHEETQTLIFKGSAAQREALESVLAALPHVNRVSEDAQRVEQRFQSELERRERQLNQTMMELDMARKQLEERQEQSLKLTTELERMKVRLEEMERLKQQGK